MKTTNNNGMIETKKFSITQTGPDSVEVKVEGSSIPFLFKTYHADKKIPCCNVCPLNEYCEKIIDPTDPTLNFYHFCNKVDDLGDTKDNIPLDSLSDLEEKYKALGISLFGQEGKHLNKIDDIAVDRSWSYCVKRWKSQARFFFQDKLFPKLYKRNLDRAIEEYEKKKKEGKK